MCSAATSGLRRRSRRQPLPPDASPVSRRSGNAVIDRALGPEPPTARASRSIPARPSTARARSPLGPGATLTILAQWPGSDVALTLISPSRPRYTCDAPGAGVGHDVGPDPGAEPDRRPPSRARGRSSSSARTSHAAARPSASCRPSSRSPNVAAGGAGLVTPTTATARCVLLRAVHRTPTGKIAKREWYVSTPAATRRPSSAGEAVTRPRAGRAARA